MDKKGERWKMKIMENWVLFGIKGIFNQNASSFSKTLFSKLIQLSCFKYLTPDTAFGFTISSISLIHIFSIKLSIYKYHMYG